MSGKSKILYPVNPNRDIPWNALPSLPINEYFNHKNTLQSGL